LIQIREREQQSITASQSRKSLTLDPAHMEQPKKGKGRLKSASTSKFDKDRRD